MSDISPAPLTSEHVDCYRTLMTRTERGDFDGLRRRGEAARKLAMRAYSEGDRAAWEVVQVAAWRLQRRNALRPTDPGEVLAIDTLYRIEEQFTVAVPLEEKLTPTQFCEKLARDAMQFRVDDSEAIRLVHSGKLSIDDLRYFSFQFVPPAVDFVKSIAFASMSLPRDVARFAYENLWEEAGMGKLEKAHFRLLMKFLDVFDIKLEDDDAMMDSLPPEALASHNVQHRMIWNGDAAWALGSMFVMEKLIPLEHEPFRDGVLKSGVPRDAVIFFDIHIAGEEHHAADWLSIAEQYLRTPEEQRAAYGAAMERGRWYRRCFEALHAGFQTWKRTGHKPRLPAKELREATGM